MSNIKHSVVAAVALAVLLPGVVLAQVTVNDDFTQAHDNADWPIVSARFVSEFQASGQQDAEHQMSVLDLIFGCATFAVGVCN